MQGVTKSRCPSEYHLFPQQRGSAERSTWDELGVSSLKGHWQSSAVRQPRRVCFVKELLSSRFSDRTYSSTHDSRLRNAPK